MIGQLERGAADRRAEVGLQQVVILDLPGRGPVDHLVGAAATALNLIRDGVGVGQQLLGDVLAGPGLRDTDAGRHSDRPGRELEQRLGQR